MTFAQLTIVTSCSGYGHYLPDWTRSIIDQTVKPGRICIFTHGTQKDDLAGEAAMMVLCSRGVSAYHVHAPFKVDFGVARNRAVELAETEWVMHLDADDMLMPGAIQELFDLSLDRGALQTPDVVQAGYVRIGQIAGLTTRRRLYEGGDGMAMLDKPALASGNSMFRRSLWEKQPYRTDLLGAWDTALWIGFARLGARFRPTRIPIFQYRQHADSIFNKRRSMVGWERVYTNAMLKKLRRGYEGVAVVVPRDKAPTKERQRNWERVKRHYETHHPTFEIVEGVCPTVQWIKGAAIAGALSRCKAEVIVIADADVMVEPAALVEAVCWVAGGFPWAMPHDHVYRANPSVTEALCASEEYQVPHPGSLERPVYQGAPGGGIVVMRHVHYDAIGGIPLAFRGWGSEDKCLAVLADRLIGPCERGKADLVHLWHPPQQMARQTAENIRLLQSLGHAAQRGRDELVQAVSVLPRPTLGPHHPRVIPIDHGRIQQRMEQRRLR